MSNAWRPIDGSGNEHEWGDEIPFEDMPATRNPAAGWVVTCNQRIVGDDYPYYIALEYAPDYRARRVTSHIGNWHGGKADVHAMGTMHADRISLPGLVFARVAAGLSATDGQVARRRFAAQGVGRIEWRSTRPRPPSTALPVPIC